jgi:hypothetical protein
VALVRSDVFEDRIASVISVERMSELGTTLAVTDFLVNVKLIVVRFFNPHYGGDTVLRNVGSYESHTASDPRIRHSS